MDNLMKYLLLFVVSGVAIMSGYAWWVDAKEQEALEKGKPASALIVDKIEEQVSGGVVMAGSTPVVMGDTPAFTLRVYVGKKTRDIDVNEDVFTQVKVGDKIDVIEYEDKVLLKK
ncbi:hypothetical protein CN495_08670 [Bacillus thuringiensis]|uniref:Uncharacterized protein n=1 Tax=Bacillus thuringiensis TaxID=1428 RepID=A0ABD6SB92_BACTU|nr:hypothetical protein [Bacillus thuringiensis]PER55814.1 hypothetical protein CN495_08670 [Bacillus thuringiensis]